MKIAVDDLVMGLLQVLVVCIVAAAALDYGHKRFGEPGREFNWRGFGVNAVIVLAVCAYFGVMDGWIVPWYWSLGMLGILEFRDNFHSRRIPSKPFDDPVLGRTSEDSPGRFEGRYDAGGPEETLILFEARGGRPSNRVRKRFREFREAFPALERRIEQAIDPMGTAPIGDWWMQCVEVFDANEDKVELTYESKESKRMASIVLTGSMAEPPQVEIGDPKFLEP